jgi:uncharacterized protein YcbK (DUF882 family)
MLESKQIAKNFSIDEFKCRDGVSVPWDLVENVIMLAKNLQILRDRVGVPITVISGYRSPLYNKSIDGAKRSFHMKAMAADIRVKGMSPGDVRGVIEELIEAGHGGGPGMSQGGLGSYRSFTHYDIRGTKARWSK